MVATPQAQVNTKVELMVEAIEDFANAIVEARLCDPEYNTQREIEEAQEDVLSRRVQVACALREFLQPVLRLVDPEPQDYTPGTLDKDKPLCIECNKQVPCGKKNCKGWRLALRRKNMEVKGEIPDIPA